MYKQRLSSDCADEQADVSTVDIPIIFDTFASLLICKGLSSLNNGSHLNLFRMVGSCLSPS